MNMLKIMGRAMIPAKTGMEKPYPLDEKEDIYFAQICEEQGEEIDKYQDIQISNQAGCEYDSQNGYQLRPWVQALQNAGQAGAGLRDECLLHEA